MLTSISRSRISTTVGRAAALAFLAAAGTLGLSAQQSAPAAQTGRPSDLKSSLAVPSDPSSQASSTPGESSSSSSVADPSAATNVAMTENFANFDAAQPPPRRRYSRPNYTDSHTNADGSRKYEFFGGGGFGPPVGKTGNDLTLGYGFQFGGGRNFNKKFGVDVQFDFNHFGLQTSTLNTELGYYQQLGFTDQNGNIIQQITAGSHIWSFTLDPHYNFYNGDKYGAYVVGGVGFYHKTATFSIPFIGQQCDYYYGCYSYQANQPIDHYTSNAPGFSGGAGVTYKFSRFASTKLYAEVRYVYVVNSAKTFFLPSGTVQNWNVFPQNSYHTSYIPVNFGIRF